MDKAINLYKEQDETSCHIIRSKRIPVRSSCSWPRRLVAIQRKPDEPLLSLGEPLRTANRKDGNQRHTRTNETRRFSASDRHSTRAVEPPDHTGIARRSTSQTSRTRRQGGEHRGPSGTRELRAPLRLLKVRTSFFALNATLRPFPIALE